MCAGGVDDWVTCVHCVAASSDVMGRILKVGFAEPERGEGYRIILSLRDYSSEPSCRPPAYRLKYKVVPSHITVDAVVS